MGKGEGAGGAVCSLHQAVFLELGVEIAGNAIKVIFPLYVCGLFISFAYAMWHYLYIYIYILQTTNDIIAMKMFTQKSVWFYSYCISSLCTLTCAKDHAKLLNLNILPSLEKPGVFIYQVLWLS